MQKIRIYPSADHESMKIFEQLAHFNNENLELSLFLKGEDDSPPKRSFELSYVAKIRNKIVIGGVISTIYFSTVLSIEVFFVDEGLRNKGVGSQLLSHLEEEAKKHNVILMHVDTFDWQAKDFYLKKGFEIFGVLEGCPKGHTRYYMKKNI